MAVEVTAVAQKPWFTADQIVNATDIQRRWKSEIEDKLDSLPYLVLLSGKEPRVVMIGYDKFEELWLKVATLSEDLLEMESLNRLLTARLSNKQLASLAEVMERAGIKQDEIDKLPDVELDNDRDSE